MTTKPKKSELKTFYVWVAQVNQSRIEVLAVDEKDAQEKGYAKWRREDGRSTVLDVKAKDKDHP
jgi:hypothetical protein